MDTLAYQLFVTSRCHFNDAVLEGGIPFNRAYGMTAFEYPETDERYNRVFNQAMSNHTTLILKKIFDVYKGFEGLNVLVDVGGGIGVTLNLITTKYPHIKGINFDLPHVLADAPSYPGTELFIGIGTCIGSVLHDLITHRRLTATYASYQFRAARIKT